MVVRWRFDDPSDSSFHVFEINPDAGGSPSYIKNVGYQNTVAPGGKTLIYEGADQPQTLEFSGNILSQDEFNAFITWFNKRHQIKLTDDLGRQMYIYITEFTPKRVRASLFPWRHTYDVKATVISWV